MGKRFSLVVGINDYGEQSALEPLRFAEADATLMAESLRNNCGFEVEVLLGAQASLEGITRALRARYDAALDLFLFFFAGHGEFLPEVGMHCLHCYGSEAGDTIGTLNLSEWASRIRHNIRADSSIMVIDACRNKVYRGAQGRGAAPGLDSSVYTALKGVTDTRDIRVAAPAAAGRQRAHPMYTLLACSAGQVSYEDARLGHGVFTYSLVEEIRAHGSDLPLGQLRRRVGDQTYEWCVAQRFSPEQVPEWIEPSLSGDVWLGGETKPAASAPANSTQSIVEIPARIAEAAAPTVAPVSQRPDVVHVAESQPTPGRRHLLLLVVVLVVGAASFAFFVNFIENHSGSQDTSQTTVQKGPTADEVAQEAQIMSKVGASGMSFADSQGKVTGLFVQACDMGNVASCEEAAKRYAQGTGVTADPQQALQLYAKACDAGLSSSCEALKGNQSVPPQTNPVPQPAMVDVQICVPQRLIDQSWDNPQAGSKMEAFRARVLEEVRLESPVPFKLNEFEWTLDQRNSFPRFAAGSTVGYGAGEIDPRDLLTGSDYNEGHPHVCPAGTKTEQLLVKWY